MSLVDDIKLLKGSQVRPSEAETQAAALRVMAFLDRVLYKAQVWTLPRGYHYDVVAGGTEQLCMPIRVESEAQAARIFANDVATGWLEELGEVLDAQRSARIRSELGL